MMMDEKPSTIAIDGPAASGKTTLAKLIADDLGYLFFDTGVMYRAVTWISIKRGVDLKAEQLISSLANSIRIDVSPPSKNDGRDTDVIVDGEDITWEIRKNNVDSNVSLVSSYLGVRDALTTQQRRIGSRGKVVMVGRDIGTVVLPDADLKIFLDASVEIRARRRYLENLKRGDNERYELILKGLEERDEFDSSREIAPLRAAADAYIIDTDELDIDQVFNEAKRLIKQWRR
jgi:cytidylate kinase